MKTSIASIMLSFVSAGIFLIASACERKLKNQPDLGSDRLFIVATISPQDTLLSVKVFNMLASGEDYKYTTDYTSFDPSFDPNKICKTATVLMSDGTNSVALNYDPQRGYYTADPSTLTLQEGTLYNLEVSAPGKQTATASCKIPKRIANLSVEIDSIESNGYTEYLLTAQWQDNPEEGNFYLADQVDQYSIYQNWLPPYNLDSSYSATYMQDNWGPANKSIVSDLGKNNQVLKRSSGKMNLNFNTTTYYSVWYNLFSVDRNFAKYDEWQRNLYVSPFAQPSLVYTNVENGLGVFAGVYKNTVLVRRNAP